LAEKTLADKGSSTKSANVFYHQSFVLYGSTYIIIIITLYNYYRGGGTGPADLASAGPKIQIILKL